MGNCHVVANIKVPTVLVRCDERSDDRKSRFFAIKQVAVSDEKNQIQTDISKVRKVITQMVTRDAVLHYNTWLSFAYTKELPGHVVVLEAVFDEYLNGLLSSIELYTRANASVPSMEQFVCGSDCSQHVFYKNDCGNTVISDKASMDSKQWLVDLNHRLNKCSFVLLFVESKMIGLDEPLYPGARTTNKPVTHDIHRTVFIFETTQDVTTMYHYDSYGGRSRNCVKPFTGQEFYEKIKPLVQTKRLVFQPGFEAKYAEHKGIQTMLQGGRIFRDPKSYLDDGYCQLYSLFWAYNVLQLRHLYKGKPLKEWGVFVERYYIKRYKDYPETLYDMVLSFGYFFARKMLDALLPADKVSSMMSRVVLQSCRGITYPITEKVKHLLEQTPLELTISATQKFRDSLNTECVTGTAQKKARK